MQPREQSSNYGGTTVKQWPNILPMRLPAESEISMLTRPPPDLAIHQLEFRLSERIVLKSPCGPG